MKGKQLLVPGVLLTTLPSVLALDTGMISEAMGTAWNAVGALFSWAYVDPSPEIRLGIIQGFVFLTIFIALHRVIRKHVSWADNKTAGVIGFSVAAITVWLTPNGIFAFGIITVGVPLALTGYFALIAFKQFNKKFWEHLVGLGILILDTFAVGFLVEKLYPTWDFGAVDTFVMTTMEIWFLILLILCIVKFFMMFLSGEGGLFRNWRRNPEEGDPNDTTNRRTRRPERETTPGPEGGTQPGPNGGTTPEGGATTPEARRAANEWPYTNLDPTRTGNVQFQVVDEQGQPVKGARVILAPNRGGPRRPEGEE